MALKAPTLPQALQDKGYTVVNETYMAPVNSGIGRAASFEIGDVKEPLDFKPQFKASFFVDKEGNNEANVSFRAVDNETGEATVEVEGDKVLYKRQKWEFHQYERKDEDVDEGMEMEWVFHEKPTEIKATLVSKGVEFVKQLPMTEEVTELKPGETITETTHTSADGIVLRHRPEDWVNSYVINLKDKSKNGIGKGLKGYTTGMLGVLKRIKAIDANGDECWGDMDIEQVEDEQIANVTVTIDNEWLNNAAYPIKVDPYLGLGTVAGSDKYTGGANAYLGVKAVAGANGYIAGFGFYGRYVSTPANPQLKCVILNSDKSVAGSSTATVTLESSDGWYRATFDEPVAITNTNTYYIGVIGDSGFPYTKYNAGSSGDGWADSSNSFTTPADASDGSANSEQYSMFVHYVSTANTVIVYPSYVAHLEARDPGSFGSATSSFSDLRNQATADYVSTGDSYNCGFRCDGAAGTDKYWAIYRQFKNVDTSVLSGKTITGATYEFVGLTVYTNGTEDEGNLHIVEAAPASNTTIAVGDYDSVVFTSMGAINREDVSTTADGSVVNVITLNSTYLSHINTSGYTNVALICEADLDGTADWFNVGANSYNSVSTYNVRRSQGYRWDYFTYTYSTGGGGGSTFTPRVMFY